MGRKESNKTKTSGLSIVLHDVISLPDATSCEKSGYFGFAPIKIGQQTLETSFVEKKSIVLHNQRV